MNVRSPIMKKLVSLAALAAIMAGCTTAQNNNATYGTDGFGEETLVAESTELNTAYLMAAAPKYYIGNAYKVEDVQYIPVEDLAYNQTGIAGIVPAELNGTKTSNGEIFDASQMLATSKTLPLPTIARVTNLDNGQSVVVRVNNRGPFVNTRIMDLSPAAAARIGMNGTSKVQIQVLADEFGNVIHLGERDCTIQRNHQKIIEETPSQIMDDSLRKKMGQTAVKVAKIANYTSLGTVEFLVDKNKNFYFMEMNTRVQVEHPITELRTNIDLIKEQIRIAANEPLKIKQSDVNFQNWVIECRVNAEDPYKNFRPCPGKIEGLNLPGGNGVRIDTAIYEGYKIPSYYDSMIAKLIVYGTSRNEAIAKLKRALEEFVIEGVTTNIDFIFEIIKNPDFIRGNYDTSFIERNFKK